MSTIAEKLTQINKNILDIRESIISKSNGVMPGTLDTFASAIDSIEIAKLQKVKRISIEENGTTTYTPDSGYDGFEQIQVDVNVISTGGSSLPEVSPSDINFYDYDGRILYSYTITEFSSVTELPALPEHEGLICKGWNYTVAEIKDTGKCEVGAIYSTTDGKTRIYFRLTSDTSMSPTIYFAQSVSEGVLIDWGDGNTERSTTSGSTIITLKHTYEQLGDHVITLEVTSGICTLGRNASGGGFLTAPYASNTYKIEVGNNVEFSKYGISYFYGLESIILGDEITSIPSYLFYYTWTLTHLNIPRSVKKIETCSNYYDYSLRTVSIPATVTTIGASAFRACSALQRAVLPTGTTAIQKSLYNGCKSLTSVNINKTKTIDESAFATCQRLVKVEVPASVTSLAAKAFDSCTLVSIYDFTKHTSIPTASATTVFNSIPETTKIVVPGSLYSEWIAAANWSNWASQIYFKTSTGDYIQN